MRVRLTLLLAAGIACGRSEPMVTTPPVASTTTTRWATTSTPGEPVNEPTSTSASSLITGDNTASTGTPQRPLDGEVRGRVLFSPVCPVERIPPDPACAPRPGPAQIELVGAGGIVTAVGGAGEDGLFAIRIAPGRYAIRSSVPGPAGGPGIGGGCQVDPAEVTVEPGSSSPVVVSCDTGIR